MTSILRNIFPRFQKVQKHKNASPFDPSTVVSKSATNTAQLPKNCYENDVPSVSFQSKSMTTPMSGVTTLTSSMAAVEALKDQGFARWNYPLRCLQHRLKNSVRSSSARPSSASAAASKVAGVKKTETTMHKVMELDCWGPTTTRF